MTKQERYDQLVSELQGSDTLTDLSAFADYSIRDNILLDGVKDFEFAKTIMIKISNTVIKHSANPTQDDLEALATAHNLSVMWEVDTSKLESAIDILVKKHKLSQPSLVGLSHRVKNSGMAQQFRESMAPDIGNDLRKDLAK